MHLWIKYDLHPDYHHDSGTADGTKVQGWTPSPQTVDSQNTNQQWIFGRVLGPQCEFRARDYYYYVLRLLYYDRISNVSKFLFSAWNMSSVSLPCNPPVTYSEL
jgi:hypothetical protein